MSPQLGWALVGAGLVAGYMSYGWPGIVLALTFTVFWLLLQWSRALRAMRLAAKAPIGTVPSAVMLHAQLRARMTLLQVLPMTGSLGQPIGEPQDETYRWTDAGASAVVARFSKGRLEQWTLERPPADDPEP